MNIHPTDFDLLFGDESSRNCRKCNNGKLKPHHHTGATICLVTKCRQIGGGEHLHFICSNCGYERTTPTADQFAKTS